MKKLFILLALIVGFTAVVLFGFGDNKETPKKKTQKTKDCEIPTFAKALGHEDKWLLHNGCPPRTKTPSP